MLVMKVMEVSRKASSPMVSTEEPRVTEVRVEMDRKADTPTEMVESGMAIEAMEVSLKAEPPMVCTEVPRVAEVRVETW